MPKISVELGALAVSRLTKPGLHFVGVVPGLALSVSPTGARSWILRVRVAGKRRDMGLGPFPAVTLAQARERARVARAVIAEGGDPVGQRRASRAAAKAAAATYMTFDQCAEAFIGAHEAGWRSAKHGQQWRNTLAQYVSPVFGDLRVRDVELPHVMQVLEPIWTEKNETASRLRGRIEQVLDWAGVRGYREGQNPARWRGHLDKLLPKRSKVQRVEHHTALPVADAPAVMARLRAAGGMGARALEFLVLTAARSGEVRGATWDEIDLDAGLWTVPADRMKSGREHRVPLSSEAVELLRAFEVPSKT